VLLLDLRPQLLGLFTFLFTNGVRVATGFRIVPRFRPLKISQHRSRGVNLHQDIIRGFNNRFTVLGDCSFPLLVHFIAPIWPLIIVTLLGHSLVALLVKLHELAPLIDVFPRQVRYFVKVAAIVRPNTALQLEQGRFDLLFIRLEFYPRCLTQVVTLQNQFLQCYQIGAEF
jgi:hypothetical protein